MTAPDGYPARARAAALTAKGGASATAAVTTHVLATEAAQAVMAGGGNAVDAAIAANAVLGVVLPDTCGPGGDLFALVHEPGETAPHALNASGRAGSGVDATALRSDGHTEVPLYAPSSVTVPGCVDGWEALLARFGALPLATVLEPAIAAAHDGFPVAPELSDSLERLHGTIAGQPSAAALYPGGVAPAPGSVVTRPDLAATLRELAEGGRRAFYEGTVGAGITAATAGAVTAHDLARTQAEWVEPLHAEVFGLDAWTIPPNSQGYLALAGSWLAERLLSGLDPSDPAYHHALIEAYRAVAWERDDLVSDPDTLPLAPPSLVDAARLEGRLAALRPHATAPWPASHPAPGGTMYLCTRDAAGMAVSLIQSNFHGVGSRLTAGATGVFLHNRGAGFTLRPGHPNELAPGKRPLHTLSPTMWTRAGEVRLILGTRGGQHQPQLLMQLAAHHLAAGMSLGDAMAEPRWTVEHWGPGEIHRVVAEGIMPSAVIDGLRERGHAVEQVPGTEEGWGPMAAISGAEGRIEAAADPRVSTSAAAVI